MNNWYTQMYVQNMPRHQPQPPQHHHPMHASYMPYVPPNLRQSGNPSDSEKIATLEKELQVCRRELAATKESLAEARKKQHDAEKQLVLIKTDSLILESQQSESTIGVSSSDRASTVATGDLESCLEENTKLKRKLNDSIEHTRALKKIIERYDGLAKECAEHLRDSRKEILDLTKMVDDTAFADSEDDGSIIFNDGGSCASDDLQEPSSDTASNVPQGFLDAIAKISEEDLAEIRNMDMILPLP